MSDSYLECAISAPENTQGTECILAPNKMVSNTVKKFVIVVGAIA